MPDSARRRLSLTGTGWTEQQQEVFHRNCDEQMRAFGYSEDETYRDGTPAAVAPQPVMAAMSLASAWQHRVRG